MDADFLFFYFFLIYAFTLGWEILDSLRTVFYEQKSPWMAICESTIESNGRVGKGGKWINWVKLLKRLRKGLKSVPTESWKILAKFKRFLRNSNTSVGNFLDLNKKICKKILWVQHMRLTLKKYIKTNKN